jgi:hypothetical protein
MENRRECCQTSKGVYEKQQNLSNAKINRDAYAKRIAGCVAAIPPSERERVGPASRDNAPVAANARSWPHSWAPPPARLWKNRSAAHLGFPKLMNMAYVHTYTELRRQIHEDLRIQHPEWVQPNGESPICDSYESRLMEMLADLEEIRSHATDAGHARGCEQHPSRVKNW